jgi:hypothetical protein
MRVNEPSALHKFLRHAMRSAIRALIGKFRKWAPGL